MDVNKPCSKYSFVFCNPLYSDCSLNLHNNGTMGDGCGPRAVPASSAVLAANSGFFKKMLSGNFKESSNKASIDIHLEAPSDGCFMDLLRFMHTESLPPEASSSLHRATELLILADRFEVKECVVACARELKSLLPITSCKEAFLVLSLPQSLRGDTRMKEVVDAASQFLVIHSSVAMHQEGLENMKLIQVLHPELIDKPSEAVHQGVHQTEHQAEHQALDNGVVQPVDAQHLCANSNADPQQCTRQARLELLDYPEAAMQSVLESKRLQGDSEDSVANAALAWAIHRGASPEDVLETLFSFVLPRLCFRSLSPRFLQDLLSLLTKSCSQFHSGTRKRPRTLSAGRASEADPSLSPGVAQSNPTRAASSGSLLHSPGTSPLASQPCMSQPHASPSVCQSDDRATHATPQGVGASLPHDSLMHSQVHRDEASNGATEGEHGVKESGLQSRESNPCLAAETTGACHPSCSAFQATGRDVLPLCTTMCQGVTARPETFATALGVFADAMVDLSELNFLRTGVLAKGRSLHAQQAQAPLLLPPRSVALPSACLCLDVPWRIVEESLSARAHPDSNRILLTTTHDVFAYGRWLKLAVYLKSPSSSPTLEVYLEKGLGMRDIQESNLEVTIKWRFCVQTNSSQPAFESYASGTLLDRPRKKHVLHIPLNADGKNMYFCQNMLNMRVDTWST